MLEVDSDRAKEKARTITTQSVAGAGAAGLGFALGGLDGALVGGAARAPLTEALEQAQRAFRSWRQQRVETFQQVLLADGLTASELAHLVSEDERKAALLLDGYREAVETHYREKTIAIARAVRSGVLERDSAKIDLAAVITRTMKALEPSHVRLLLAVRTHEVDRPFHQARFGVKVRDLVEEGLGDVETLDAHMAFLQGHGLVRGVGEWEEPRPGDHWTPPGWDITWFGLTLLDEWSDLA